MPQYEAYRSALAELNGAIERLEQASTGAGAALGALSEVKSAFVQAYTAYQRILIFDFEGQELPKGLSEHANTFPSDIALLSSRLQQAYPWASFLERIETSSYYSPDILGFPAMEFLLYGDGALLDVEAGRLYLSHLARLLSLELEGAYTRLIEGREVFVTATDFSTSGTISKLLNTMIYRLEKQIRTAKVGVPIGKFGYVGSQPNPNSAEALYLHGGHSILFIREAISSLITWYHMDQGLRAFLADYVEGQPGMASPKTLSRIDALLEKTEADLASLEGQDVSLLARSAEGLEQLGQVYEDLQGLVGLFKSYIMPGISLSITYTDGEEGD